MIYKNINELNKDLIQCRKCDRLVSFRESVGKNNKRFKNEEFWSKPVPGFGDINGELLILGLAPAPTGGNRTGRVFTGDKSAEFLMKNLYKAGLSNKPNSVDRNDGLILYNTYLTAALKCVPPDNIPTKDELNNCSLFLHNEIDLMTNLKAVLTLGRIAFDSIKQYYKSKGFDVRNLEFKHGKSYDIDNVRIFCSYHPSPRNVNTGVVNDEMFFKVLEEIKKYLGE